MMIKLLKSLFMVFFMAGAVILYIPYKIILFFYGLFLHAKYPEISEIEDQIDEIARSNTDKN